MTSEEARLEEYRQVSADRRHYDLLRWTVVGLTYPTAFAGMAYGRSWGFMTGRSLLILALSSLWLVAGSLVFGQIDFYGRVRRVRAQQLEKELGFENVGNPLFDTQPARTLGLAFWFHSAVPAAVVLAWGLLAVLSRNGVLPGSEAGRDSLARWSAASLLVFAAALWVVRTVYLAWKKKDG